MLREFRMPDVGEGLTEAEVLAWHVSVGETVAVNQTLVEVETAKAAVELPSPFAGRVRALLVAAGDVVAVGVSIIAIDDDVTEEDTHAAQPPDATAGAAEPLLVGYGVKPGSVPVRRPRRTPPTAPGRASPSRADSIRDGRGEGRDSHTVRRTHVERLMAAAMTRSAQSAAHVTEWVDVDVTQMSAFMREARDRPELAELAITPLTIASLALARAAHDHPTINSTVAEDGAQLLLHHRVNLGIAVDSPRGLVVPHVPDAQDLDLLGMAEALGSLVDTARAGRSSPEQLRGSTITITNLGVLGVDSGTPLVKPGEVAILALGRLLPRPWVVDGEVAVRDVMTLALSFDHRAVDGSLASAVLRDVAEVMADPRGLGDGWVAIGAGSDG